MLDVRIVVIDGHSTLMPAVFALRYEVFVVEQAVAPEMERDEYDETALHLAALQSDRVVGTLRIVTSGGTAKIGRMAVNAAARKQGVGSRLMQTAEVVASQRGAQEIVLHAQLAAKAFYSGLGYQERGEVFEEAGIQHVEMRKTIA